MMGLEHMLKAVTGMSTEEMRGVAQQGVGVLANLDNRLANIERMVAELHAAQFPSEALLEHDERNAA